MEKYVLTAEKQLNKAISPGIAVFFSDKNMTFIQNNLIHKIGELGYQISRQSDDEVFALMLYVYTNTVPYAAHHPSASVLVKNMNSKLTNILVPMVHSNILQYIQLLKDQSSPLAIMPRAQSTNVRGSHALEINL